MVLERSTVVSTHFEMHNLSPKEVSPPVTAEDEHSAPVSGEMTPIIEQIEKPCPTITLKEQWDMVESVLGMNFDEAEIGSS